MDHSSCPAAPSPTIRARLFVPVPSPAVFHRFARLRDHFRYLDFSFCLSRAVPPGHIEESSSAPRGSLYRRYIYLNCSIASQGNQHPHIAGNGGKYDMNCQLQLFYNTQPHSYHEIVMKGLMKSSTYSNRMTYRVCSSYRIELCKGWQSGSNIQNRRDSIYRHPVQ